MSILKDIAIEGFEPYSSSERQRQLLNSMMEGQSKAQRHRLLDFVDMTADAAEYAAHDNYFRGFCNGLWFAEQFLQKMRRI